MRDINLEFAKMLPLFTDIQGFFLLDDMKPSLLF
jgi:hypothetical protein